MSARNNKQIYTIGEAARYLVKSIMTLRRWVTAGKITCIKTPGGFRRFTHDELERVKEFGPLPLSSPVITAKEATHEMGVSKQTIKRWGEKGKVNLIKDNTNHLYLEKKEVEEKATPKLFDFFSHQIFPHEILHVGVITVFSFL